MTIKCKVIKEYGQYELLNVSDDERDQISRIFLQFKHDAKVTGNIIMEGFHCNNNEEYKDGEYKVRYTIRGIQKQSNLRKSSVWVINSFGPVDFY